jgi:hypothetical protein
MTHKGIRPHEADLMDLTTIAAVLGVHARPAEEAAPRADGLPKPPPWWTGDDDAANSSIEAARQMGFVVGMTA